MTTLKVGPGGVGALVGYYDGLARDQLARDGTSRGPVDYYVDADEPPGRWWGSGRHAVGLDGAGIYVGMTRGRGHNVAWVLDPVGNLDPEEALAAAIARPANARTAHATRVRMYEAKGLTPPARELEPLLPDDPTARIRARLDRLQQRPPVERSLGP